MEKGNKKYLKKVVLIGPESTGKTELARFLSKEFCATYIPEYAREYITRIKRKYSYKDVEHIAKKQVELEKKYEGKTKTILFYDTYLIITKIWFELVFNKIPLWINDKIKTSKIDLFLLCNTDIPWKPDLVRENGGIMREKLFLLYKRELEYYRFNYKIISGTSIERYNKAQEFVKEILN